MQIMNLSGFIKKVSFTACHLDKLYLAFASPIDTLTYPKGICNKQDWLQLSKNSFEGCLSTEGSPSPFSYTVCHVAVSNLDLQILLSALGLKRGRLCLKIWGNHCPETIYALFSENCWNKIIIILLIGLITNRCFLGMSLHTCTKKTAGCMGYYGLSHYCQLKSSREHHKIFFLEKISKVFFDVACNWVIM